MTNVPPMNKPGNLFAPSKSYEKHLSKSDILGKDTDHWPASFLKRSFFYSCFWNFCKCKSNNWFLLK